jgi:hypothetical protein
MNLTLAGNCINGWRQINNQIMQLPAKTDRIKFLRDRFLGLGLGTPTKEIDVITQLVDRQPLGDEPEAVDNAVRRFDGFLLYRREQLKSLTSDE